nr:MAG TPA: hypothetical protein [Caudoviricetes sp.]
MPVSFQVQYFIVVLFLNCFLLYFLNALQRYN